LFLLWEASQPEAGAESCPPETHAGREDDLKEYGQNEELGSISQWTD